MTTPELESGDSKLVEAWNYHGNAPAELGKYKLDQNGIPSEIFGGMVDSWYRSAIGGISLMVRKKDLQAARKILESQEEVKEDAVSEAEEITYGSLYCGECHSKDIRVKAIRPIRKASFIADFLRRRFGHSQVFACRACGAMWKR